MTDREGETFSLPQALLFAGARQVLFATIPPDDEATHALMVKFHELWRTAAGAEGRSVTAALREAQAFVRGHSRWAHPYYWGTWVLWGVPK